ncbi:LysR family transcriptional regulator [Streptomyces sp. UG1]|uniref:LysR family transcriptional regulator n=1 Tax=Streptomyces sp. UG1 TaxID=3417652 RepID=UPI003CE70114
MGTDVKASVDVDTRVLRYFVAVAEHLSFTRAAKELFVSQPSLSRQIRQLEIRLGAELFARTKTEVRLTRAGEVLLGAARRQLADWQHATRTVRAMAAGDCKVLRIGFVATGGGVLGRRARALLAERRPDFTIEPKRLDWGGEANALRQGLVDVAFLWLPADTTGLRTEIVATEPRWVGMAGTHPLARSDSVTLHDIRDAPLMWTRRAPTVWVDWWAVNPRPDGSAPVWGPENDNVEEMLEQVATTGAVCIGSESMASYYTHPDLVWRPVTDIDPLRIAIAWPQDETVNPLVPDFVRMVRKLARQV